MISPNLSSLSINYSIHHHSLDLYVSNFFAYVTTFLIFGILAVTEEENKTLHDTFAISYFAITSLYITQLAMIIKFQKIFEDLNKPWSLSFIDNENVIITEK